MFLVQWIPVALFVLAGIIAVAKFHQQGPSYTTRLRVLTSTFGGAAALSAGLILLHAPHQVALLAASIGAVCIATIDAFFRKTSLDIVIAILTALVVAFLTIPTIMIFIMVLVLVGLGAWKLIRSLKRMHGALISRIMGMIGTITAAFAILAVAVSMTFNLPVTPAFALGSKDHPSATTPPPSASPSTTGPSSSASTSTSVSDDALSDAVAIEASNAVSNQCTSFEDNNGLVKITLTSTLPGDGKPGNRPFNQAVSTGVSSPADLQQAICTHPNIVQEIGNYLENQVLADPSVKSSSFLDKFSNENVLGTIGGYLPYLTTSYSSTSQLTQSQKLAVNAANHQFQMDASNLLSIWNAMYTYVGVQSASSSASYGCYSGCADRPVPFLSLKSVTDTKPFLAYANTPKEGCAQEVGFNLEDTRLEVIPVTCTSAAPQSGAVSSSPSPVPPSTVVKPVPTYQYTPKPTPPPTSSPKTYPSPTPSHTTVVTSPSPTPSHTTPSSPPSSNTPKNANADPARNNNAGNGGGVNQNKGLDATEAPNKPTNTAPRSNPPAPAPSHVAPAPVETQQPGSGTGTANTGTQTSGASMAPSPGGAFG